jgi:hypothetical protein
VFNDKWGLSLKQNGCGKGGKKWTKNWIECEQTYKELMSMTGQSFSFSFFKVGEVVRWNKCVWRTNESKMRTRMTVQDPTRR